MPSPLAPSFSTVALIDAVIALGPTAASNPFITGLLAQVAQRDQAGRAVLAARGLDHATVQVEPPGCADDCPGQTDW